MPNTFIAVTVTAVADTADSIGAFLLDQGAPGLITEDTPAGVRITAHFREGFSRAALDAFVARLPEWFPDSEPPQISCETATEQDWADNWKTHFPPLEIGTRLWVHPPWITDVPAGRVPIMIDPGMAFGTGHHASTRGCLTFLDRFVVAGRSQRVLDIGTGSGVLAIAAAKLGASAVCAVDIDSDACEIAVVNTAANGVAAQVQVRSDLNGVSGNFDIVVANLFATQLVEMAGLIHACLAPGGTAIGSGLLIVESESVIRAWEAAGLSIGPTLDETEWMTITAQRR